MTAEQTMRAVVLTGHGGLDRLEYRTDRPSYRTACSIRSGYVFE